MIRITRNISIALIISLCMIFGLQSRSHSNTMAERQRIYLEKHVQKVRLEKPKAYQEMVDKAGGTIVNCLSCHDEEFKKKENSK
jgi:hypothetical protein